MLCSARTGLFNLKKLVEEVEDFPEEPNKLIGIVAHMGTAGLLAAAEIGAARVAYAVAVIVGVTCCRNNRLSYNSFTAY